jgi:Domain of unknown function (DUF4276)
MAFQIVPIVEGDGEVQAVGPLLRRLIVEFNLSIPIVIARPWRQPRGTLLKQGGIEKAVEAACIAMDGPGAVLVLLDSEGGCPAQLGPEMLTRARHARPDQRMALVLAHHEFEAWFLAAASSLARCRGLAADIKDHPNPEAVAGCKEWLEQWMPLTSKYSETADQPALVAAFDMHVARRRAPSFDKLWREFEQVCRDAAGE